MKAVEEVEIAKNSVNETEDDSVLTVGSILLFFGLLILIVLVMVGVFCALKHKKKLCGKTIVEQVDDIVADQEMHD